MIAGRSQVCRVLPAALAALLIASSAAADEVTPSFDCKKATGAVEKRICNDDNLGFRDGALGGLYRALLPSRAKIPDLQSMMRHWLRARNTVCGKQAGDSDEMGACLTRHYDTMLRRLSRRMTVAKIGQAARGLTPLAGTYVAKAEGFAGTITVVELPDLSAFVEISTVSGRNAHICQLHTGAARRTGSTIRWRDKDQPKCQVTLRFRGSVVKAEATSFCRRDYCGANTDFVDFPYKK